MPETTKLREPLRTIKAVTPPPAHSISKRGEGRWGELAGLGGAPGFTRPDLRAIMTEGTRGTIWLWILVEVLACSTHGRCQTHGHMTSQ